MNGILDYVLLCLWLFLLHSLLAAYGTCSFFFIAPKYSVVRVARSFSLLLLKDIWIVSSFLVMMHNAVKNVVVLIFLVNVRTNFSLYILRNTVAQSWVYLCLCTALGDDAQQVL